MGWIADPMGATAHGTAGGQGGGLGRADAFADGLGEGRSLGTQVTLAPSWPGDRETSGVKSPCGEVAGPVA